jgi:hypothetical protein
MDGEGTPLDRELAGGSKIIFIVRAGDAKGSQTQATIRFVRGLTLAYCVFYLVMLLFVGFHGDLVPILGGGFMFVIMILASIMMQREMESKLVRAVICEDGVHLHAPPRKLETLGLGPRFIPREGISKIQVVRPLKEELGRGHLAQHLAVGLTLIMKEGKNVAIAHRFHDEAIGAAVAMNTAYRIEVLDPLVKQDLDEETIYRRFEWHNTRKRHRFELVLFGGFLAFVCGIAGWSLLTDKSTNGKLLIVALMAMMGGMMVYGLYTILVRSSWMKALTVTHYGIYVEHAKGEKKFAWNEIEWLAIREGEAAFDEGPNIALIKFRGMRNFFDIDSKAAEAIHIAYESATGMAISRPPKK